MAFDRFNDKPSREKRFEHRDSDRFSDRRERSDRFERRDSRFSEDRPAHREGRRFDGDRPFGERQFGDRPFGKRPARESFRKFGGHRNTEAAFGQISGARARALEQRRYSDHAAFAQTATVRLDPDVAKVFKDARSVNAALRAAIALGAIVESARPAGKTEETAAEVAAPETEAAVDADVEAEEDAAPQDAPESESEGSDEH